MAVSQPPLGVEDLRPRRYQEEVFEHAKQSNIIAALGTGSGKTYISNLLIKWIASQEESKDKIIIFVVPQVALVEQQADFLSRHSSLRVLKLHGGLADFSGLVDKEGWANRIEQHDIVVITAQLVLNCFTHAILATNKISLAVIDECHHARKNHPYNTIMLEFLRLPANDRPKIFGMTASPIYNSKNPILALETLERNMDAKVISVRENIIELSEHMSRPVEVIHEYDPPSEEYPSYFPNLWMCMKVFRDIDLEKLDTTWTELERRYNVAFYSIGPFCADYFLLSELRSRIQAAVRKIPYDPMCGGAELSEGSSLASLPPGFGQLEDILDGFEPFFQDGQELPHVLDWCTPKVKELVDILLKHVTPTSQTIIFVQQRHTAICLAFLLSKLPKLQGLIRCQYLLGVAGKIDHTSLSGVKPVEVVKMFRKKEINLIVATDVAEEGLDFPACDVIIRFDPLQHMVGYIQSRGRARAKSAKFIVMVHRSDKDYLDRYKKYLATEPVLNSIYKSRAIALESELAEEEDEQVHPDDLAARERYVVPSTGAFISYDNSLTLVSQLCSMIPCDQFTKPHQPAYTGDYQATIRLPAILPIPRSYLIYLGRRKHSKKEARRSAAFTAVKKLHEFGVFDDYLLPAGTRKRSDEDGEGYFVRQTHNIPPMLNLDVRDPWSMGDELWCHPVCINGKTVAGIVTGSRLPCVSLGRKNALEPIVATLPPLRIHFSADEGEKRGVMQAFTRFCVWYKNTASPFSEALSLYLVPLTACHQPDLESMDRLLDNPYGNDDWSTINETHCGRLLIVNQHQFGRSLILNRIRDDLTPLSKPPPSSREEGSPTYQEYLIERWKRKRQSIAIPSDGPMLEVSTVVRSTQAAYGLDGSYAGSSFEKQEAYLVPQKCCRWVALSEDVQRALEVLPALARRMTDVWRASEARTRFSLGGISDNMMIESLTVPSTDLNFSNQRLEILGDAVIEVCTTVHLLNKYPYRHEGQIDVLRQRSISNRFFMARALDISLEGLVIGENRSIRSWQYVLSGDRVESAERTVRRAYPRRSLQDCIEAIAGASFETGGIPLALQTTTSLGLTVGGPLPWCLRYDRKPDSPRVSPLFSELQDALGYDFRSNELLIEAVTHPSFSDCAQTPSYQRLEFLGDAVLDLVVVKYLFDKYPKATSELLSRPRSKAVCAPCLASLAIRKLHLHKIMLVNNVELSMAIDRYVPVLESLSAEEIVNNGWMYDPPKAISDLFESVVAAVFVDSGYDYERTACVVEHVMDDVLAALSPSIKRDPISEMMEWIAKAGCSSKPIFSVVQDNHKREGVIVMVHDVAVTGTVVSANRSVARALAAQRALSRLSDPLHDLRLSRICSCRVALPGKGVVSSIGEEPTKQTMEAADNVITSDEDLKELTEVVGMLIGDSKDCAL